MKTAVAVVLLLLLGLLTGAAPATASPDAAQASAKAAADPWLPKTGPTFNSPISRAPSRLAILHEIHEAIRHTPAGQTIRFASFNFDRRDTADLLLRAKARGVNVQVVVNDNIVGDVERRLQSRLGRNPARSSFFVICHDACRNSNSAGNMHIKIYSFSQTGSARGVIISSSGNLSSGAIHGQWNDAYTLYGDSTLFSTWMSLFRQLRYDRAVSPRRVSYRTNGFQMHFQRQLVRSQGRVVTERSGDAPINRLNYITCTGTPSGYGNAQRRTIVRINMYAWYGTRGERIAKAVAAAKRRGCNVAVIGSVASKRVVAIIRGAGIPMRAADWDWGEKAPLSGGDELVFGARCYSHLKFLAVDGIYKGAPAKVVWTGSENWSAPALSSDEVTLEIYNARVLKAYFTKWRNMYDSPNATHAVNIKPTRRPCA